MEFEKMFRSGMPIHDVFMEYSDVIDVIIPGMEKCKQFNQNNKYHKHNVYEHMICVVDYCNTKEFEIKLTALLHDIGKPASYSTDVETGYYHYYGHPETSYEICKYLLKDCFKLTTIQYNRILKLIRYHDISIFPNKKSVRKALANYGEQFVRDYIIHRPADMDDHVNLEKIYALYDFDLMKKILNEILEEQAAFKITDLKVNGKEIVDIAKQYEDKPKEIIGKTLNHLLDLVISEKLCNIHDYLIEEAREFIKSQYT